MNRIFCGIGLVFASFMFLCSCAHVKYVPVETIKTEVEYRDRLLRDSIYVHDSIYVREKGDTVFVNKWHTLYKDRLLRDTIYVNRTDTIRVPYPVEKELSKWEAFKIEIGGWAFGIVATTVSFIIVWLVYKKRRR